MRHTSRRRQRGMFLVNMLITIGLLAAFVIVAERVFRLSLLTTTSATAAEERAIRLERAADVLRADVWRASNVDVEGTRIRITNTDGKAIEWRTADAEGGTLVRAEGSAERRWPGLALTFALDGGVLSVSDKAGEVAVMRRAGGAK